MSQHSLALFSCKTHDFTIKPQKTHHCSIYLMFLFVRVVRLINLTILATALVFLIDLLLYGSGWAHLLGRRGTLCRRPPPRPPPRPPGPPPWPPDRCCGGCLQCRGVPNVLKPRSAEPFLRPALLHQTPPLLVDVGHHIFSPRDTAARETKKYSKDLLGMFDVNLLSARNSELLKATLFCL